MKKIQTLSKNNYYRYRSHGQTYTIDFSEYPNLSREEVIATIKKYKRHKNLENSRRRSAKKRYIYMRVTTDEYELPLAVGDSAKEVAEILGMNPKTCMEYYSKKVPGFIKLEIDPKDYKEVFGEERKESK